MQPTNDRGFKMLFSNAGFVQRLLTAFVDETFVRHLDFDTLQRGAQTLVGDSFRERDTDIVWSVQFHGHPLVVALLLEFQSTRDRRMPLRILRYVAELYEAMLQEGRKQPLPAVFPIVLYNGDQQWDVPTEVAHTIQREIPPRYVPQLTYHLLDTSRIEPTVIRRAHNAVSAVFLIDQTGLNLSKEQLDDLFGSLDDELPEIREVLAAWFNDYLSRIENPPIDPTPLVEAILHPKEARTMFATKLEEWQTRLRDQGREEGREEGQEAERQRAARRMIDQGFDPDTISAITSLSPSEVRAIKDTGE